MCLGTHQIHLSVAYGLKFQIELELDRLNKSIVGENPMFPAVAELLGHTLSSELDKVNDAIEAIWNDIEEAKDVKFNEEAKDVKFNYGISEDEVPF